MALKLRSGNVIAFCRVAVALALLGTALGEARGSLPGPDRHLLLMAAYLAWSLFLLVLARTNWWLSHHLTKAALAADFLVAFTLLYMTEVTVTGAVSPFMAFFIFLLLSATLQWKVRGALAATALSIGAYLLVGAALYDSGNMHDNPWFARRLVFMIAIAGFIAWVGLQGERMKPDRLDWPLSAGMEEQFGAIARYTLDHLGATGLGLVWSPKEEPWTVILRAGSLGDSLQKNGPRTALCESPEAADAILFDRKRERALLLNRDGRIQACRGSIPVALADELGVATGIIAPIPSEIGCGMILLTGIPAVCADNLLPARQLADELGSALDRHEMVLLMQHQEAIRLRADFARDLHDSVAQSLAGTEYRIAALRQGYAAGKDISADLAAIQDSLGHEARHVHAMIAELRRQEPQARVINASEDLRRALEEAADRWGIACSMTSSGDQRSLRKWLVRELQLIIREAVANAVRHAGATQVNLSVESTSDMVTARISNDGADFSADWLGDMPQSIAERVDDLGGTLEIDRETGLTRLSIHVPTEQV
jgi:signal transduction histidine kinase